MAAPKLSSHIIPSQAHNPAKKRFSYASSHPYEFIEVFVSDVTALNHTISLKVFRRNEARHSLNTRRRQPGRVRFLRTRSTDSGRV